MNLIQKLLTSAGLRQSMILTGGNLVAVFFSAIGLLLISRSLGPEYFGEFTVGYSLMIIIVRVQGMGLNIALQKVAGKYFENQDSVEKLSSLFKVSTLWNLGLMGLSLLVAFALSGPIANLLNISNSNIIFGSFIFASVTLFFEYIATIFQILHRFAESVYMMLTQSVLKFIVALAVFISASTHVTAIFYAFYLVPVVAIAVGLTKLPTAIKIWPPTRDVHFEHQLLRIMKHSAILMITAGIIDYIDVLFVRYYTTPVETGIYGGMSQLAGVVGVLAFSLASVLNARVARYHSKNHIDAYIKKAIAIGGLAALGFVLYLPFNTLLIQLTLGSQYLAGAPWLAVLMLASFILLATVPFIALFYTFETSTYFSVTGLGQLFIAVIGGNYFIAHYGLDGAVWIKVATRVFLLAITLVWAYRAYKSKVRAVAMDKVNST